jgi:FkbM family methyltransferase
VIIGVNALREHWSINPVGVLHVGAHTGEEAGDYEQNKWLPVTWIEAQEKLCIQLKEKLNAKFHSVVCAAVWDVSGVKINFNVSSNSQSSSLLEFGTHSANYPENVVTERYAVETATLSDLTTNFPDFDFVNLDIQGVELQALRGLGDKISNIKWIYTEVNKEDVYRNCTKINDLDDYLGSKGFTRIATRWCLGVGWGDALYSNQEMRYSIREKIGQTIHFLKWYSIQIPRWPVRLIRRRRRSRKTRI